MDVLARTITAVLLTVLTACTGGGGDRSTPGATTTPATVPPTPSARPTTPAAPTPTPPPTDYGGQAINWPQAPGRGVPGPALGAVVTRARVTTDGGGTLAAGLVLPRVGGTTSRPRVLTPCGRTLAVRGRLEAIAPSTRGDTLVLLDPGHGGRAAGTRAPDGRREADEVLDLSRRVRTALTGRVDRVVLTRDRDLEATLEFRVALADMLAADLAVSVHLNAEPDTLTSRTPGLSTYGSVSDPAGRRAASVLYAAQRRYLDTLASRMRGGWAADRDAGALYRTGRNGRDYYGLLRQARRSTWVISESLYLSAPRDAALLTHQDVRTGLARAVAGGAVAYLAARDPGSGWRRPYPRGADPAGPPLPGRCTDPR